MSEQVRVESFVAGGTINPARFVTLSAEGTVVQAQVGDEPIGISDRVGSPPSITDSIQALLGERLDAVLLGFTEIRLGGTVSAGNYLVSDANGKGVAWVEGAPQPVGARALQDGVADDLIRCKLVDAGPLATGS